MIGSISIPAARVHSPIVQGVGASSLARGAGHYPGTFWPGQGHTVVLAGHDVTFVPSARGGHVFHNLALGRRYVGARIFIRYQRKTYVYRIVNEVVRPPTYAPFLSRLAPDRLVLTTCYPPGSASERLIVFARPSRG